MPIEELRRWLETLFNDSTVVIHEDGLCIIEVDHDGTETGAYLELGGQRIKDTSRR